MSDSNEPNIPVKPGDVLAGKYRVERILGMGGMGVVVAATHLHLEQRVAIKFLLPEIAKHPETVARFSREARAAVRIQSEHVGRVLDVGALDTGSPYMVMEFLEGSDLSDFVKSRGPRPWNEAVEFLLQACEAMAEAHKIGIVHRDLKPANLFLARRPDGSPCVKVLDFGISKVLDSAEGSALTQTAAMMGSPKYMSPEQLKSSRDVDARTDIWALGVILYELLSGEGAFRADTVPQLYVAIIQDAPQPLKRTDIPPGLVAVIMRCLEKDPARRFQSVAELAFALSEFASQSARTSIERISRIQGVQAPALTAGFTGAAPSQMAQPAQPLTHAPTALYSPPAAGTTTGSSGYGPPSPQAISYPPAQSQYPGAGGYPGAYAQQQNPYGQAPPQQMQSMHQMQPAGYGSHGQMPSPAPQKQALHPAFIVLLTLVALFAIFGGGCMLCVCVSTTQQSQEAP